MKINFDLDISPAEARQFFGLPDLKPVQDRLLVEMEQRFRETAAKLSPEAIMTQWFAAAGSDQMKQIWDRFTRTM